MRVRRNRTVGEAGHARQCGGACDHSFPHTKGLRTRLGIGLLRFRRRALFKLAVMLFIRPLRAACRGGGRGYGPMQPLTNPGTPKNLLPDHYRKTNLRNHSVPRFAEPAIGGELTGSCRVAVDFKNRAGCTATPGSVRGGMAILGAMRSWQNFQRCKSDSLRAARAISHGGRIEVGQVRAHSSHALAQPLSCGGVHSGMQLI